MNIHTRLLGTLLTGLSMFAVAGFASAADRPYTEGAVVNVGSLRTEPGQFEAYMAYLAGPYKKMMEEQKAAGIILDYSVYVTTPRSPGDPDIYLLTVYKNMAALDGLNERTDPIQQKMFGDLAQRGAATAERGKMRTVVGGMQMRKLELK
ncbi:MAG TPA: hypothetical protein VLH36_04835 [Steroidobacteraceae bacterium]|jgi:hypothetical protein|nr:hypothetical protein [Steroidobacteraceae bacterium]